MTASKFCTIAEVEPRLRDRTLTVNGASKTYAMTGWRVGFAGGPKALIAGMINMQGQATAGVSTIGQAAAAAALDGPQDLVQSAPRVYQKRRDMVVDMLSEAPGLACHKPEGAFYVFPNIAGCIGKTSQGGSKIETDTDFVAALLEEKYVATVQGAAYGMSPYFRISYATDGRACARPAGGSRNSAGTCGEPCSIFSTPARSFNGPRFSPMPPLATCSSRRPRSTTSGTARSAGCAPTEHIFSTGRSRPALSSRRPLTAASPNSRSTCAAENGADNVRVVTTDRRLVRLLASKGVTSIGTSDLLSAQATSPSDAGIEQAARRIVSAQHRNLASGLAIALAGTAMAIVVVRYHQLIFHTAPDWIVPIALLLAGLLFFWWRERDRFSYGLFEVMIGLLISSQSIVTLPAPSELSTAKSIQLVGGLYVMVRGLDNIDRSVEDTRLGGWWGGACSGHAR